MKILNNKLVRVFLFITIPIWFLPVVFFYMGYLLSKDIWKELNKELDRNS